MYIQVISNLNQEGKRLGNKFSDNAKNLNSVNYFLWQSKNELPLHAKVVT
jgi:hypothetical protein